MRSEFWHSVWEDRKLGFHMDRANPFLMKYWGELGLSAGDRVFVPLCGKSLDMIWLAEQKHPVVGVELSPIAGQEFFSDNDIEAEVRPEGTFMVHQGGDIELMVGDFFNLTASHMRHVRGVYDRAALVALPETMRQDYANHMANLLTDGAKILLMTFEYDQEKMSGPPHSIGNQEVRKLFESNFMIQQLESRDLIEKAPGMQKVGLQSFMQTIYLLEKLDY